MTLRDDSVAPMSVPGGHEYGEIESLVHIGQVSALALISSIVQQCDGKNEKPAHDWLVAGMGSQVYVFRIPPAYSDAVPTKILALPHAIHVHGIVSATCMQSATTVVGVYGDRYLVLYLFDHDTGTLRLLTRLPRCCHWIMCLDLQIHSQCDYDNCNCNYNDPKGLHVLAYVGLSDNSVEVYQILVNSIPPTSHLLHRVECGDRCLLYSMGLLMLPKRKKYFVAGGTVFLDIVVWSFTEPGQDGELGDSNVRSSPVLYRLKGHQGSIHCVRWGPLPPSGDTVRLASGSDDRTLRVWTVSLLSSQCRDHIQNMTKQEVSADHVLFGHTGRLWGVWFWKNILDAGEIDLIVTASEDGTCQFWDAGKGACLYTLQTHKFRGVWQCLFYKNMFFTAGSDAAIKAWSLLDIFPQGCCRPRDYPEMTTPSVTYTLQRVLPMPEDVQVGEPAICYRPEYAEDSSSEQNSSKPTGKSAKVPAARFDSTAEWIRDLAMLESDEEDKSILFIATNRGVLHRVDLTWGSRSSNNSRTTCCIEERWRTLYVSPTSKPLCTVNAVHKSSETQSTRTMLVGACEITGRAILLHLDQAQDSVAEIYEWHPCMTGLSIFFPFDTEESLSSLFFDGTSNSAFATVVVGPRGEIAIYGLNDNVLPAASTNPRLLMSAVCPSANRITCVSSSECSINGEMILVTGTSTGGVTVWKVGGKVTNGLEALHTFSQAHEVTPVKFVSKPVLVDPFSFEFESAGSNGTIQKISFYFTMTNATDGTKLVRRGENKCDDLLIIVGFSSRSSSLSSRRKGEHVKESTHWPSGRPAETWLAYCWGFKGTRFGVWRQDDEVEVCSIACGSWRRPWTVSHTLNGEDMHKKHKYQTCLTFAFDSGGRHVTVYRRILSLVSPSLKQALSANTEHSIARVLPTSLSFSPFHGREINALAVVSKGVSMPDDLLVVITGGEDATLRGTSVVTMPQVEYRSHCIGEHAGGTAVKSMALVPMNTDSEEEGNHVDSYLLITAGSKRVLTAWIITTSPFRADWISSHIQEHVLHRKSWPGRRATNGNNNNRGSSSADIRYVAVDVLYRSRTQEAFIIAATSTGKMEVMCLGTSRADRQISFCQSWAPVAQLVYHTTPVLSLRCLELNYGEGRDHTMTVVVSGGTDGSLVVWNLADNSLAMRESGGDNNKEMHPAAIIPNIHQSGINDLSIFKMSLFNDELNTFLVVSAGDDQSVALTVLGMKVSNGQGGLITGLGSAVQKNAHASSVRGIWADDKGTVFSVGLDQRVRRWQVYDSTRTLSNTKADGTLLDTERQGQDVVAIKEIGSVFTQVLEPSSIGVEVRKGASYGTHCYVIAIAGRGMEILRWS